MPDLHLTKTEFSRLQQNLNGFSNETSLLLHQQGPNSEQRLSLPTFRQIPISEFDGTRILQMIFPTLFPTGQGDINLLRGQKISFEAWIRHLLYYKDRQFALYSQF